MANFNVEGVIKLQDQFTATANKIASASDRLGRGMETLKSRARQLAGVLSMALIGNKLKHGFLEAAAEEKLMRRFDHFFENVKNKVGMTKDALMKELEDVKTLSGFDVEDIMGDVTAPLLRSGKVTGANLLRAQQLAANIAAMNGNDQEALKASGEKLAQALSNPMRAMRMVREFMSPEEFAKMQKSMKGLKSSQVAGLQDKILTALEGKYKGGAASMADSMSTTLLRLRGATGDLNSGVGNLVNALLGQKLREWAASAQNLASTFSGLGIELKKIEGFQGKLAFLAREFEQATPAVRAFTVAVSVLAFGALAAVVIAFGKVGAIVAVVTAGLAAVAYYWEPIKTLALSATQAVEAFWGSFAKTDAGITTLSALRLAFEGVSTYVKFLYGNIELVGTALQKLWDIAKSVGGAISKAMEFVGGTTTISKTGQFDGGDAEANFYTGGGQFKLPAAPGIQGMESLGAKAEAKVEGQVNITINDKSGAATVNSSSTGNVPVNVGKTAGGAYSSNDRRLPPGR